MLYALLRVIDLIFSIYTFILVARVVISWLHAFNIINSHNRIVQIIGNFVYQLTEPLLRPLRRILPNFGSIDLSPIVIFLIIYFLRIFISKAYFGLYI